MSDPTPTEAAPWTAGQAASNEYDRQFCRIKYSWDNSGDHHRQGFDAIAKAAILASALNAAAEQAIEAIGRIGFAPRQEALDALFDAERALSAALQQAKGLSDG